MNARKTDFSGQAEGIVIFKFIICFLFGFFLIGIFSQDEAIALPSRLPKRTSSRGGQLVSPICECNHCRTTSNFGQRWGRLHAGQDIACNTGFPVRASSDGVVRLAGRESGYGYRVEIVKDSLLMLASGGGAYRPEQDIETSYSHLSRIVVRPGARVQAGDVIGYCGNTGASKGSHLHYEVRVGGVPLDPRNFFNGDIQRSCPTGPGNNNSSEGVEV